MIMSKMRYTKDNPLRVFEAFAGYGSQSMALDRLKECYPDFDFKVVGISEIDEDAIRAYRAVHGDDIPNYGDISKIDWGGQMPDFDLFTMSSPCQDFSIAGKRAGGEEGSGTRSSLLWECTKAIEIKRPKYILFENVKGIMSGDFIMGFNRWRTYLEHICYSNFVQVLNAKDYGIPQNRERVFMISIYRGKDMDEPRYYFPKPFKSQRCIKDVLEQNVQESYFLSDNALELFTISNDDKN